MKKRKFLLIIFSILFLMQISTLAFARAGGGRSSGGGGSSGGGSSSSSSSTGGTSSYYSRGGRRASMAENIIGLLFLPTVVYVITRGNIFVIRVKTVGKCVQSRKLVSELKRKNSIYSRKVLKKRVEETYFALQEAWSKMDYGNVKEYMSEDLYKTHTTKLGWLTIKNQKNILDRIKLLSVKPISVQHYLDISKDVVWFYIKGSMIDYIIDNRTKEVVEGSTFPKSFVEYWKFIRVDDNWILDKICQIDEIIIDRDFPNYSEE